MSKVKNNFLTAGVCIAIAFICLFGYLYLQNMSAEIFIKLGWETRVSSADQATQMFANGFVLAFLFYAVLPPLLEELIFRFAVCKTLQWAKLKPWLIIGISAVVFALYHRSWSQLVYQLIMGIFLAWIFLKTNNLGWTILIHFINNAFIVTYTYFVRGGNDVFALNAGNIALAISSAVVATVVVALLIKRESLMQPNKRYTVTMIVYLTAMVLLVLLQILASSGCFAALSDEAVTIIGSVLPQIVIMLGVPFLMLLSAQKINGEPVSVRRVTEQVGWRKMSIKNVLLVFLLGICLYLLNIFIASFFSMILQAFGYQYTSSPNVFTGGCGLVISLLLTAVLPAICEEFLHRGVLLNGLIPQFGVHRAILLVSLLFGLMHMNAGQFFYATILGWFFCVTALSTRSLWASVIVHFVNNALATYFSYADELHLPGMNVLNYLLSNPVLIILTLLVAIVAIAEILRHLARENFERDLDTYTVRYLSSQNLFDASDFDQVKNALPRAIKSMSTWKATMAYIETFDVPQRSKPLPKALLWAVCVLGGVLTVLSLIWGTW